MAANSIHQAPVMASEQREVIGRQVGDVKPATDELIVSFAAAVANRRDHAHPEWEDPFCADLSSYMGERMAPVLRRLMDAEAERDALRTRVTELEAARRPTAEFVSFIAVEEGDRVRFATADNGYGGMGEVWRTGTVSRVTARTVVVECDENLLGDTAVLRQAEWGSRSVRRAPAEDPHDSPLHHDYALGRNLPKTGGAS